MNKRELARRLEQAITNVEAHISSSHDGGVNGRGLSREGFAGGYSLALMDVQGMLNHGGFSDMGLSRIAWGGSKE